MEGGEDGEEEWEGGEEGVAAAVAARHLRPAVSQADLGGGGGGGGAVAHLSPLGLAVHQDAA